MGRPERIDYRGAWHHVINRGARRAPIFKQDQHCGLFLGLLAEACQRYRLEVHAYALMSNHYHLLLRSPQASLSRGMSYLGGEYTRTINRLHSWDGPVFKGRFASQLIRDPEHLVNLLCYLHLNPVRAGLIRRADQAYWTSHRAYLDKDVPPEWLHRDNLLALVGGQTSLASMVRGLRSGQVSWPEGFDLDSGFFDQPIVEPKTKRRIRDRPTPKVTPPDLILRRVRALTGASAAALKRNERGRGANPARRFAVWALCQSGLLTYADAGKLLTMSPVQAGHTVRALRRGQPDPIHGWMEIWEKKYGI